jgi:hypothetical protein
VSARFGAVALGAILFLACRVVVVELRPDLDFYRGEDWTPEHHEIDLEWCYAFAKTAYAHTYIPRREHNEGQRRTDRWITQCMVRKGWRPYSQR